MMSVINKSIQHLKNGKVILCPTDTIWGLSCDATNFSAVEKIYDIKGRSKEKSFIVLVSSLKMLMHYVEEVSLDIEKISSKYDKPVTIIYPKAKNLAKNVVAKNGSIAIRIIKDGFTKKMIEQFGKPIVSTSANFSNKNTAENFNKISEELKVKVDYIVETDYGKKAANASSILLIENNKIKILRE
ncbi:MAG: L-threonylcarbamoyladenylate synthase [Chitinophagales bacterium]